MKQSIVALIRPKLNLSQKESQSSHLIEHLLVEPKRLQKMGLTDDFYAENIVYHGGEANDFYMTEYCVVRSESADTLAQMLLKHQDELYLERDEFNKIKSSLIEELNESRGEFIEMGEQLAKAIFLPGSPTIRNPWYDLESIVDLTYKEVVKIFHKYNKDIALLKLSFDDFSIDRLPTLERNVLCKPSGVIELIHPWQAPGSVDFTYITPLPSKVDLLTSTLYRRSLTDLRFGILFQELRHNLGLVYDVSTSLDYDNNTLDIYFSSSKEKLNEVTNHIKKSLENYDQFIKNNLDNIKKRLKLDLELEWGDVQNLSLAIIELAVSGGYTETNASLIKRLDQISVQDLINFDRMFFGLLNKNVISIKCRHGKDLATKTS